MTDWLVEACVRRNPMIVNPRPGRWFTVAHSDSKDGALANMRELRAGAKACNLNYKYRVRETQR